MGDELLVGAAGVFESVGQHGEAISVERAGRQMPLLVGGRRECRHNGRPPCRIEDSRTERVAEDVAEKSSFTRSRFRFFPRLSCRIEDSRTERVAEDVAEKSSFTRC